MRLDTVPDISEMNLMSEEVNLDQLDALSYLREAEKRTGNVSASSGLYQYYEERYAALQAVKLLFQSQIQAPESMHTQVYRTLAVFNASIITKSGGFIERLTDLIRSSVGISAADVARVPFCIDSYGRIVDRAALIRRECTVGYETCGQ